MKKLTKKQAGGDTSATTKVATYRAPWAPKKGQAGTVSIPLDAKKKGGAVKSGMVKSKMK